MGRRRSDLNPKKKCGKDSIYAFGAVREGTTSPVVPGVGVTSRRSSCKLKAVLHPKKEYKKFSPINKHFNLKPSEIKKECQQHDDHENIKSIRESN